jgi:predicted transcriptional regulator
MSELILYTSDDGRPRLDLRVEGDTVWLSQLEIAELFQTTKQNVSLHAKNIFEDGELAENSVVKESLTTAANGKRYKNTEIPGFNPVEFNGVKKTAIPQFIQQFCGIEQRSSALEDLEKDLKRKGGKA